MAQDSTTAGRRVRMGLVGLGAAGQNHLAVLSRLPEVDPAPNWFGPTLEVAAGAAPAHRAP